MIRLPLFSGRRATHRALFQHTVKPFSSPGHTSQATTECTTVSVSINGRQTTVPAGSTILEAAQALKIRIPTLCYHPRVKQEHQAVCRMCLVHIDGSEKMVPACVTKVQDNTKVHTSTPDLVDFRRTDLEMLLSRHPNDCMRCEVNGNCKLQSLVREEGLGEVWPELKRPRGDPVHHPEHHLRDDSSEAIVRDMEKCIECGLCVAACGKDGQNINAIGFSERAGAVIPVTEFDKPLSHTNCIGCGQCTVVCPVGALTERSDWREVLHQLESKRRPTVVQVAPACRVAIGEEFGLAPGSVSTGKLCSALRMLGFDFVFDTNFTADLTIMEEASELISRVKGKGTLPLMTSCCPGWVNYVETTRPDLFPHLSTTKSPQQMHGALTKRGPFGEHLQSRIESAQDETFDRDTDPNPFVVSVMPCSAKKDEAKSSGMGGDVDAVVTTRELARMIRTRGIPFSSLADDGDFDNPLGESSGAGSIFGASGGVMEAALRSAFFLLSEGENLGPLEFTGVRGVQKGVKVAEVEGLGKVAVCSGISSAIELLSRENWKEEFLMIEVMACVGGCLGGGGEPKSDDPDILRKRAAGVYSIDERKVVRRSHENSHVQKLYREFLNEPLSHRSERLLHRTYAERHSRRDILGKFLDALDVGDCRKVSDCFTDDGILSTTWVAGGTDVGLVKGKEQIEMFVENYTRDVRKTKSVPRDFERHRFKDACSGYVVELPSGEHVEFKLQVEAEKIKYIEAIRV